MAGFCGFCIKYSMWKPAVKVYQYVSEILSVTHVVKCPSDATTRKASVLDINLLEEKYLAIKKKQKDQSHVIVYKAGENKLILGETLLKTVPVNKIIEKQPKAFKAQIPVRDVTLEVPCKGYLNDGNDEWHTHLNIHRMVQVGNNFALENGTRETDQDMNFENTERGRLVQPRKSSASSGENIPVNDSYRRASLKHTFPASWLQYPFPSSKSTSPTDKVLYYPFPQKKTPRISDTARKLGLY
ncbi:uncharacterized protein C9orf152-like [Pelodytes ibericus]